MTDDLTPPHWDSLPPVKLPTLDTAPDDLAHAPEVPHHRFSTFYESGEYAYARGLEVNPIHLPVALDAMRKSNWHLVAIFGQTDSQHIGFIFRRQAAVDTSPEIMRLRGRIDDLLRANNDLVEKNRELKREIAANAMPDAACTASITADGGSCGDRITCSGVRLADGTVSGGCGEPCSFVMDRVGG